MSPARAKPTDRSEAALAEIVAMADRLAELRDQERNPAIVGAYRAAIDRLQGLAYRIHTRPQTRVYGLPGKPAPDADRARHPTPPAPAREPPTEPPQRALPLGPVSVIVRTASRAGRADLIR